MGIDTHTLNFLRFAARDKPLGKVATIGRQAIHISPRNRRALLGPGAVMDDYCEALLQKHFGATTVESYDNSDYEGATHVSDMNQPLATDTRYDTVFDGGCLEHIFDPARALRNFSLLCAPGGQIIHSLPANNQCGHGFWQVSPELFFSLYSEANGYRDTRIFLAALNDRGAWYEVKKPVNGERAMVTSRGPVYTLVRTRKAASDFRHENVQQSDYVHEWKTGAPPKAKKSILFGLIRVEPVTALSARNPHLVKHRVRALTGG